MTVPADSPRPPADLDGEMLTAIVPLLDQVHASLNRDVLVIAAGARIDGRLLNVDDDTLVLTVEDKSYRYFVDLQSVSVLAVER